MVEPHSGRADAREVAPMFRVLSLVAVMVLGWAAAILLLFWGLVRLSLSPHPGLTRRTK
jgi:hypothetical protein